MSLVTVLIILALIALNGLFVAAEFAIVGAPKASIERLARQGSRAARAVLRVLENPRRQDRLIATAQLGITLASLGLGMYGEHLLAEWLAAHLERLGAARWVAAHTVASVTAVAILTYFHIVLGEMVPKSIALQRAQRTVLWLVPLMRGVQLALYPLVLLLNGIGNGLLRVLGVDRGTVTHEHYRTPEELGYLVRETAESGMLRGESARVVQELLEFGNLTASEVMVPRVQVVGLPLGASREAIRTVLAEHAHTRYPVYEGTLERIVGTLHVKDLLRCLPSCTALDETLVRPVALVPPTADMDHVLAAMNQAGSQLAVVLDEHGGTAGIVTVEDLFEEVVGEFGEDAGKRPERYRDPQGREHAAGALRLDRLGDALGLVLEHEEVDTVGGLVLSLLGRPPVVGDVVVYDGVRLEVVLVEGHGVGEVVASHFPGSSRAPDGG